ncbi:MAG: tetratricopeptide repeat protein, partial [Myxococcaceae bacterium]|nr:tetratricopeptide repeat protein [Myxococcaceae bacterium]
MSGSGLTIERAALEQLAALLLEHAGLKITPDGYKGLRLALEARMPALGLVDATDYLLQLKYASAEDELRALLPLVTVGKTEFFRDHRQFEALEREVFPPLLARARREGQPVRAWSAGCATGEEAYSIAMVALDAGAGPREFDFWATDLNPVAIDTAAAGRYPVRRLLGVSEPRLARYFTASDEHYEVKPQLRHQVRFEQQNLAAPHWPQVGAQALDFVFCRNVIIYFDQPAIVRVMARFFEALRPGGWLFLGYSETLFRVPTGFEMVEVGDAFIYRRPLEARPAAAGVRRLATPASPPGVEPSAPRSAPSSPEHRSAPPPTPGPPPAPVPVDPADGPRPGAGSPVERLAEVIRDLEAGAFPRALRLAHRLVDDVPHDLAARVTLGNVHALMGNVDEAREAYQQALQREPLSIEARLYLGLAALQGGESEVARQEFTRALFLEPALALCHYLLGQV